MDVDSGLVDVVELLQFPLQAFLGEHVLDSAPGGLLDRALRTLGPALDDDQPVEISVLFRGAPEEVVLEVERLVIALFHSVEFLEKTMSFDATPLA